MNSVSVVEQVRNYKRNEMEGIGHAPGKGFPVTEHGEAVPEKYSNEEIGKMIEKLNSDPRIRSEKISFRYHEATQRVIVSVINADTEEVIRELPTRDMLRMIEHMKDYIGVLLDESR